MGVFFGLLSAIFWGLGDFLITRLTRQIGTARALLRIQLLSLLSWTLLLLLRPDGLLPGVSIWAIALLTGVCHVVGLGLVYRAFEIGTVSLVSPISSGFAIVTALLALAMGERPPALALVGALLLVVGVILAATSGAPGPEARSKLRGIPEALGSALAFGTMFWLFYFFLEPAIGFLWPLIILKVMASVAATIALRKGNSAREAQSRGFAAPVDSSLGVWALAAGAALSDTLAWITYIQGMTTSFATIVTALASLFSVITLLLAGLVLRERLARMQWAGVVVILVGVLLVSI